MDSQVNDWGAAKSATGRRVDVACALAIGFYAMFWIDMLARRWNLEAWLPVGAAVVAAALVRHLQPPRVSPSAARALPQKRCRR